VTVAPGQSGFFLLIRGGANKQRIVKKKKENVMILEYTYTNRAWGYVFQRLVLNLETKQVFYESNNSPLTCIATIEPHEMQEFQEFIQRANVFTMQLTRAGHAFDAGDKEYFLVTGSKKIKLGQKGNDRMESSDPGTNNLVLLMDKYVKLALPFINKVTT
jgi:hypothetical protein